MKNRKDFIKLVLCFVFYQFTQDIIGQNIYLFDIKQQGSQIELSNAYLLTSFNRSGINTDPTFIDNNKILISSNFFDKDQMDILQLDLATETVTRMTQTQVSETKPKLMRNEKDFSVLLNHNQLHSYPINLSHGGNTLTSVNDCDDYMWYKSSDLYLIEERKDNRQLVKLDYESGRRQVLLEGVSDIAIDKYQSIVFAHQTNPSSVFLKKFDPIKAAYKEYTKMQGNSLVFTYLDTHKALAAVGSKIYAYNMVSTDVWTLVEDLSEYGIKNIVGLETKGNKIFVISKT